MFEECDMKITNSGRGIHQREIPGLDKLRQLPDNWHAFTNLDLALPGRGMREIDLVMVLEDRLLLVDLKDWLGPVVSKEGNWFNGKRDCGRSPVHKINENVRELTSLLRKFITEQNKAGGGSSRKLPCPWIEGVVVLTRANDRSGISGSEVSRVFSVDPFMRMLRNRTEREAQLGESPSKHTDFTTSEWIGRFRHFFNTSTGIFQAGTRRYGGFRAKNDSPTFAHRDGIFTEFDVDEEDVQMSAGLLRRWDFTKAETRFQAEEGRGTIVGREKSVIAWLDDRSPACGSMLLKPKVDDPERGVSYWEVFEKRRRMKRLAEFCEADFRRTTAGERVELARQILASAKLMHDLQAAHLDIGPHSIWLEAPTTIKLSHFMAASFPEIKSLGSARFQFLSSSVVPEDVLGGEVNPLRKDVFLLGCAVHAMLFGKLPAGSPPDWDAALDCDGLFSALHPWFARALDVDKEARFANASEMLDAFNAAASTGSSEKAVIEGLDRFRTLKSQRQVFQAYPESDLIQEDERVAIWRTESSDGPRVVKLWKGTALGDIKREAPRILSFLERAESHIESPVSGTVALRHVHWTGDAIVLVQDLVEGPTLQDEIAVKSRLSELGETLGFFRELADIVNVLHDRSLAHGDLKPANIVVSSRDGAAEFRPVLIDLLDFSTRADGERMSTAYAPPSGGRFERDRFAVTRMVEEVIGTQQIKGEVWADIARAIDQCRNGPPENSTLLPLMEALDRALRPADPAVLKCTIEVSIVGADAGPMLSDEGVYWISRLGVDLNVRGAAERLEVRLDSTGKPLMGRRVRMSQSAIQRDRRFESASFPGEVIVGNDLNDFAAIEEVLARPEIATALQYGVTANRPDTREEGESEGAQTEAQEDEIAEKLIDAPSSLPPLDVRQLWRRMVDVEAELKTEAICLADSTFRQDTRCHVVPVQLAAGEFDFDRDDTVGVERQDTKGRWTKVGTLDIAASTAAYIAIDSWINGDRQALVPDGSRLRFQSRYENTSRERREAATSRILHASAAAPGLFDVFQPTTGSVARRIAWDIDEAEVSARYSFNPVQTEAFANILQCRPVGLLQGPPGTGKTRFIGALVHYALTRGLARNVLLASQSHEAVNNAAEAVLDLFGADRDALSLIRVGHEGSISELLKPHHVARVERAYKDRFVATSRQRLSVIAQAIGLDENIAELLLWFEDAVSPVLSRITELAGEDSGEIHRLHSLIGTVEQQLATRDIRLEFSHLDAGQIEEDVTDLFLSELPVALAAKVEKFRHVVQLTRDIVGSVSTWHRSFETFLAGTRQVVAGTCVGLGRTSLGLTKTAFDLVIVDEAARCTSSELAVPIQAGRWIVLVGDQAQLEPLHPATVVQSVAEELRIPLQEVVRSDFERVFDSSYGRTAGSTLTKQYRMLPPIGRIVSSAFYGGDLVHGRSDAWIDEDAMPADLKKPLTWVCTDALGRDAYQRPARERRGSLVNYVEADAIVTLIKRWAAHAPFVAWLTSRPKQTPAIGVICAYAAQRDLVWKKIQAENLPEAVRRSLKVDTIDSYQGKENLIVLLSLVRNNSDGPVERDAPTIAPGFMARRNRINVALSRAMDRLVIVGARKGWRQSTPLAQVAAGFADEVTREEATVLEALELIETQSSATMKAKKGVAGNTSPNARSEAAQ
ncbi:hypothetical protein WJ15_10785 [Burkholderia cepacia]|nr:hypothetical protein WJ15_10785 [Burkholderia cepacia]